MSSSSFSSLQEDLEAILMATAMGDGRPTSVPRRLLLTGKPGSGKSRLVQMAIESVREKLRSTGGSDGGHGIDVILVQASQWLNHAFADGSRGLEAFFHPSPSRIGQIENACWVHVVVMDHLELLFPDGGKGASAATFLQESEQQKKNGDRHDGSTFSSDEALVAEMLQVCAGLERGAAATSSRSQVWSDRVVLIGLATDPVKSTKGSSDTSNNEGDGGGGNAIEKETKPLAPIIAANCFDTTMEVGFMSEADRTGLVKIELERRLRNYIFGKEQTKELSDTFYPTELARTFERTVNSLATKSGGITIGVLTRILHEVVETVLDDFSTDLESGDDAVTLEQMKNLLKTISAVGTETIQQYHRDHPSAGHCDVVTTRWTDIAGLHDVKMILRKTLSRPMKHAHLYAKHGVLPSIGVLLHGPPGTGKTLLAKAMATELNASFIYVDLPQLIHAEVGESERTLNFFFETAKERSPALIFFDELQAAFGVRQGKSKNGMPSGTSHHESRLVSALLNQLDMARQNFFHTPIVFVGATNLIDNIDEGILAPGRIDTHLHVGPPTLDARKSLIRKAIVEEWDVSPDDVGSPNTQEDEEKKWWLIEELAKCTNGCSGAELRSVLDKFTLNVLSQIMEYSDDGDEEDTYEAKLKRVVASGLCENPRKGKLLKFSAALKKKDENLQSNEPFPTTNDALFELLEECVRQTMVAHRASAMKGSAVKQQYQSM